MLVLALAALGLAGSGFASRRAGGAGRSVREGLPDERQLRGARRLRAERAGPDGRRRAEPGRAPALRVACKPPVPERSRHPAVQPRHRHGRAEPGRAAGRARSSRAARRSRASAVAHDIALQPRRPDALRRPRRNSLFAFNRNTTTGCAEPGRRLLRRRSGLHRRSPARQQRLRRRRHGLASCTSRGSRQTSLTVFNRDGAGALTQGTCSREEAVVACTDARRAGGQRLQAGHLIRRQARLRAVLTPGGVSIFEIDGDDLDQQHGTSAAASARTAVRRHRRLECIDGPTR